MREYVFSQTKHPLHIDISKDRLTVYFGAGYDSKGIYAMSISASSTPTVPFIDGSRMFYGFNVNPAKGEIYALNATDYTSHGWLLRYSAEGNLIKQYVTGVAPNGAVFR